MTNNNMTISTESVEEFKEIFCDENGIIKNILKESFLDILKGKILDVGGGTADILSDVVPEEKVVHLDILDFSSTPIPAMHSRIIGDFLNSDLIDEIKPIDTLFMSHVQQFIDEDIEKLNRVIDSTDAKNIIFVEDVNDDFLGKVVEFSFSSFANANPELKIDNFPRGYVQTRSVSFTAIVKCNNFESLARQCLYLMDVVVHDQHLELMKNFLQQHLDEPKFTINQQVNLYQK